MTLVSQKTVSFVLLTFIMLISLFIWPHQPKPFEVCMERTALQIHSLPKWSAFLSQVVHKTPKTSYGPFTQAGVHIDFSLMRLCCLHQASLQLFERLGFAVHLVKSVLTPSHPIIYLGFILNSVDMAIILTDEKKKSEDSKLCFSVVEGGCLFCAYVSKVYWTSCSQFSWCHVWTSVVSRSGEDKT